MTKKTKSTTKTLMADDAVSERDQDEDEETNSKLLSIRRRRRINESIHIHSFRKYVYIPTSSSVSLLFLSLILLLLYSVVMVASDSPEIESCVLQKPKINPKTQPQQSNSQHSSSTSSSSHHHLTSHHYSGGGNNNNNDPAFIMNSASSSSSSDLQKHNNELNNYNRAEAAEMNPTVICHIRTLHFDLDIENLTSSALPLINSVNKLRLICNDVLFFESILNPSQITKLTDLQELTIEKCKLKYLPSSSFNGLYQLKTLSIQTGNSDWASKSLELSIDAFTNVPGLKTLNLGFNHMWNLPEKLLCSLNSLTSLNLTHNLLSDILDLGLPKYSPSSLSLSSIFSNPIPPCLNELKSLDVSYNNLAIIDGRRFESMRRLQELRLEFNLLESLHDESFYSLNTLKLLNLSSNKLSTLPTKLFLSTKLLRELDLRNNSIKEIPIGLLASLEHLQILDLSNNQLTSESITITTEGNNNSPVIVESSTSSTETAAAGPGGGSSSSSGVFTGLVRLIILNLSNNLITSLSSSTFIDLHQVQNLNLENNQITTIEDSTFAQLNNLHTLNLAHNKLTTIGSSMLNGLFVLSKLSLDHNSLTDIEIGAFRNCTSLQDLGLVGNQFTTVPLALQGLQLLKTLDIGENLITLLNNDSFSGLGQLYGLRIVGNRLSSLPRGLCDPLKRLRVLNLASNRIKQMSSTTFVGCPELRVLLLNSNALEEIPSTLSSQLSSLLWLNVSENQLKSINYQQLPNSLEWIDLSHNQLETINGAWSNNNNNSYNTNSNRSSSSKHPQNQHLSHHQHHLHLRVVDASNNHITQLNFHSIPSSLEILRLGHNKITKILPDTFGRATHLRRVELFGNQLENLALSALRLPLKTISTSEHHKSTPVEFFLGGNPFLCDCELEWLTKLNIQPQIVIGSTITRQYPIVADLDSIVCRLAYSRSASRIPLPAMKSSDFLCKYESICFSTCHCCGFTCDCEMTCSANCTCYHDDNWSANVVDCSTSEHTAIPNNLPMDSTEVYLDGNSIPHLKSHTFIGRKNLRILYLNASNIQTIANKSFNGLQSLRILHLEDNKLKKLEGYEFEQLTTLNELYLHDNSLEVISNTTFLTLKSLEILRIDGNQLVTFSVWQLSLNPYLVDIGIARNNWNCGDCQFLHQFYGWVTDNSKKIVDLVQIRCVWNSTREQGPHLMDYNNTCDGHNGRNGPWTSFSVFEDFELRTAYPFILLISVILLFICSVTFLVACRENVRIWIFSKFGIRLCSTSYDDDDDDEEDDENGYVVNGHHHHHHQRHYNGTGVVVGNGVGVGVGGGIVGGRNSRIGVGGKRLGKLYDCYFIYSEKDEEFITTKIAEELESIDNYRLCLQHRDLIYESSCNPDLTEIMSLAVESSKSVAIFLSRNFFQGDWTNCEYKNALYSVLKTVTRTKRNGGGISSSSSAEYMLRNVLIIYIEPIPETEMSSDLKSWLRSNKMYKQLNYCNANGSFNKKFWRTLKYLLPDPSNHYQSNITSHTTSSSASSGASASVNVAHERVPSVMTNKYSDGQSTNNIGGDNYSQDSILYHQQQNNSLFQEQQILAKLGHSSPTQRFKDSSTDSKQAAAGPTVASTKNDDSANNKIPSFLFQQNMSSPVPLGHLRFNNSNSSSGNIGTANSITTTANNNNNSQSSHIHSKPTSDAIVRDNSYNDDEHVYSTLDPPSPVHHQMQSNTLNFQHHQLPKYYAHHQQQNIHLPNGYTYSPQQKQQQQQPQSQPHWQPPPYSSPPQIHHQHQPPATNTVANSVGVATSHKLLGGIKSTTIVNSPGSNNSSNRSNSRQKDSVQTYLV